METPPSAPAPTPAPDFQGLAPGRPAGGGRYLLKKILGQGGMSVVWLAHDKRLREPVVLKFLPASISFDPAALDDLRRETYRSRKLSHPNIVRIHDLHEEPGELPFLSMEYVDGADLHHVRARHPSGVLAWKFLAPLARQLGQSLAYAHEEKIIHRDIKPANLLLDSGGRLKLADFGLACAMRDSLARLSGANAFPGGTINFMSPQQADGLKPQVTDDLYSVGASLYDLLTSTPPFYTGDLAYQVRHNRPQELPERLLEVGLSNEIPPAVGELVMACLAKDPGKRPQSAAEFLRWLEAIEAGGAHPVVLPVSAPPSVGEPPAASAPTPAPAPPPPATSVITPAPTSTLPEPPAPEAHPTRVWAFAAAFILLAGLGLGGPHAWKWWQSRSGSPVEHNSSTSNAVASVTPGTGTTTAPPALGPNPPETIFTPPNTKVTPLSPGRWESRATFGGGRVRNTTVWNGREMIVWGGCTEGKYFNDGFAYDPSTSRWRGIPQAGAPSPRASHAGVWTGRELLIWGGRNAWESVSHRTDGGRYDPAANVWRPMNVKGAPTPRSYFSYAWNGEEMLVWGGQKDGGEFLTDGGRYNPATDTWLPIPAIGGPGKRSENAAVWDGFEFMIWGGCDPGPGQPPLNTGFGYNPKLNRWRPLSLAGAPSPRLRATAVWTGREVIIWGGVADSGHNVKVLADGARYNPFTDTWSPITDTGAPAGRCYHTVLWNGAEMIVWGGMGTGRGLLDTGARYEPRSNTWRALETAGAPSARMWPSVAWTGDGLLVYSGFNGGFTSFSSLHYYRVR